jgi:methylated-DNA-[protein]-cysteine S-methyltransferase
MSDKSRLPQDDERVLAGWLGDDPQAASSAKDDYVLDSLDRLWADGPPEGALAAMCDTLDAWWAEQRLVVYYDSLPSPIGEVFVAATGEGIVSVDFGFADEGAFVEHLVAHHVAAGEVRVVRAPERVADVARQLAEYFRGERDRFDFPLDLRGLTDFQRQVLDATQQVPSGEIVTYKEIARRIGKVKASRAVGNALGCNPVPIIIPCHRVLPQNGSLGGYSGGGGAKTKARLLALEGVLPGERGLYATP